MQYFFVIFIIMKAAEKHITILSLLLIVYSCIFLFIGIAVKIGMPIIANLINDSTTDAILNTIDIYLGNSFIFFSLPGIISGIGLIFKHPWSRISSLVVCIISLLSIPFGTCIGIYGIYVLMQDDTILLFK